MGLVNRVVPSGEALAAAVELARTLAAYPQECLRNDLASVHHQHGLSEDEAMAFELEVGLRSLHTDALGGAARFAEGAGRHGAFDAT